MDENPDERINITRAKLVEHDCVFLRRFEMYPRVPGLTMSALILAYGAVDAIAQERMTPRPNQQQTQSHPTGEEGTVTMGPRMMGQGMMCRDMMGGGMMGRGIMGGGMTGGSAMGSPMMFRMMFALMDDGDGEISLQEFQAAHERIFKAMDRNKDGQLTQEEMQAFMQGTRRAVPQQ